jgi:hypothetical protein
MNFEQKIAAAFKLSDEAWQRHANPWSVWTRNTVLPILVVAIWSRVWLGWWSLVPIALAVLWMWLNPHVFPPPASTDNWASKAVLGERVWLNRDMIAVPAQHRRMPLILSAVSSLGLPFLIWGLVKLEVWPTVFGATLIYLGKLWFLDRMVWLYEDMKDADSQYRSWLR